MRRVFALCLVLTLAAAVSASAQMTSGAARSTTPRAGVNLELKDVDLRSAVEALFRNSGRNFSIDANVTGAVPAVSFKDVAFDTALRNLTKSAGLVYRVDSSSGKDIYIISKKPDVPQDSQARVAGTQGGLTAVANDYVDQPTDREVRIEKVPLFHTSASEILAMLGSGREYASGSGMAGYGMSGYGTSSYGMSGYGMPGYGTSGYGTSGYGMSGYGMSGYGTGNYGSYSPYGGGVGYTGGYGSGIGGYGSGGYGNQGGYGTYRGW